MIPSAYWIFLKWLTPCTDYIEENSMKLGKQRKTRISHENMNLCPKKNWCCPKPLLDRNISWNTCFLPTQLAKRAKLYIFKNLSTFRSSKHNSSKKYLLIVMRKKNISFSQSLLQPNTISFLAKNIHIREKKRMTLLEQDLFYRLYICVLEF